MLTLKLLTLDEQAISLLSGNKELNCRFYREMSDPKWGSCGACVT